MRRLLYCLLLSCCFQPVFAQVQSTDSSEIMIELHVQNMGDTTVMTLIRNENVWLSIQDVFGFLGILNLASPTGDTLSGFFLNTDNTYSFDINKMEVSLNGKVTPLSPMSLIKNNRKLFLRADLFNTIFNLDCRFDFRSLSINLITTLELPIIREKKQALMRSNMMSLRSEHKADTILYREHAGFRLGMMDWLINSTSNFKGTNDIRVDIAIGAMLLGGETTVSMQYNDKTKFSPGQQYYLWRYVANDSKILRQISVGKIYTNSIASIFAPVIGVQLSNSPTQFRRSFGNYRINRYTEPGWMVELYVNNSLVDYTRADASGFYSFDVPMVYGNTFIQVRYYGPNGEQRTGEANISLPFTFLPLKQFEYTASMGLVQDSTQSRFSRIVMNYGLFNRLTIGGGTEYLSSITGRRALPFLMANFRLSRNILFSSEYTSGVRSVLTGNYRLPSNLSFEINYTRYEKGQQAIYNSYLEERRASISFPLRIKKFSSYSRFSFYQIVLPDSKYTTAEALFTAMIFGASTNFTTYALFSDNNKAYLYSNLSLGIRLPGKIMIMPQIQYEYNNNRLISLKGELEKRISIKGYVNVFYEHNFKSNFRSVNIGMRYELPHTLAGFAVRKSTGGEPTLISSIGGSIVHDSRTGYLEFTNKPGVGRGGLILLAFLDLNNNGKKDIGEPKVKGLQFLITGGTREENKRDTNIIVRNLEAYNNYLITIDRNSFDEISWEIKTGTIRVEIDPNQFRLIEIPVTVSGEVSGTVFLQTGDGKKTLERILVNFYNEEGTRVAQTLSTEDGSYSYLGLKPGTYTVKPDHEQMLTLKIKANPAAWHLEIESNYYGAVQKNIDFLLVPEHNPY
ncbi:MAG: carboxypeptidase-like regulatory domain-containing protein [Sediminibacterium sp.]